VSSEPTQYLVARLRDALAHDHRVAALDIQVRIVGQDLYLTGQVATPARRDAARAVVNDVAPELEVHNQLDVLPVAAPTGQEEIR
jgi:osmotically-inducible protein OsmY